jgi:uncharacterized protein YndB with AHSA1/START domain
MQSIALTSVALSALGVSLPAAAAVMAAGENGFTVRETVHIAASPSQVYDAIIHPEKWWNAEHTFSNNAANLTLDARAGGCFCEKSPDGRSFQHLVVVMASPGKALTLRGALGPFQSQGVDGALSWVLTPAGNQTDLVLTYNLGGYLSLPGGFDKWSKGADSMLAEQVARLQKFVEESAKH